jgi:hypothetical protein
MIIDARPWEPYHVQQRKDRKRLDVELTAFLDALNEQQKRLMGRQVLKAA